MYSFSRRKDIKVVDEPLYGYYLNRYNGPKHPGQMEIIDKMDSDAFSLIYEIIETSETPRWNKMMTKHIEGLDWSFLLQVKNALLIRDPRAIVFSYSKVMPEVSTADIGIDIQKKMFSYLTERGCDVPIIDSADLLKNPEGILSKFCNRLGLKWNTDMLSWEKGPIKEDGIWAKYWYENIHKSTGFKAYQEKKIDLTAQQELIVAECKDDYDYLYKHAIK